jgi:heme-degrading monooxygenase HmoA
MGPISDELMAPADGLMGLSFTISSECAAVRTLSVWESEEAMMRFVTGPAHAAAIQATGDVSRGGSITMTFEASEFEAINWENVVPALADHDGPVY